MQKTSKHQSGFTAVEGLLIVLILVVIAAVGYMVYHNNHKKTDNSTTTASKTSAKTPITTKPKTVATVNPYAGWLTSTLQYEKITYQYPSDWSVTNNSAAEPKGQGCTYPGVDRITLTSPSNEQVTLHTGEDCLGDGGSQAFGAISINSLGENLYLAFENDSGGAGTPTSPAFACLARTSDPKTPLDFPSKNIYFDGSSSTNTPVNSFCYYPYNVTTADGNLPQETISSIEKSKDFNTAKLIFESMHY